MSRITLSRRASAASPRWGGGWLTVLVALALALSACNGGGLPEDPQEAVAQAFESRFEGGATISATLQASDQFRQQVLEEDPTQRRFFEALTAEDAITITTREDEFALAVSLGDSQPIQLRALGDAFYLLVDVPAIVEFSEADVDLEQLRAQVGQFSMLLGDLAQFVQAALEGNWAGVVEIPDDAGQRLRETVMGTAAPTPDPGQATELASELGLNDPRAFVERYLEVEQANEETYTATLQLRELVNAAAGAAPELGPAEIPTLSEQELQEVPETIEGVTIETEEQMVSAMEVDLGQLAAEQGQGTPTPQLSEGDLVLRLAFSAPNEEMLQGPEDATTVPFEDFLQTIQQLSGMFGGQLPGGGTAPQQPAAPQELPSGLELPQPTPTG